MLTLTVAEMTRMGFGTRVTPSFYMGKCCRCIVSEVGRAVCHGSQHIITRCENPEVSIECPPLFYAYDGSLGKLDALVSMYGAHY